MLLGSSGSATISQGSPRETLRSRSNEVAVSQGKLLSFVFLRKAKTKVKANENNMFHEDIVAYNL